MDYPYVTVDVFTASRFGGNPLAVIPDARGLSDVQMQQIAAEFHYSEATFVLPPTQSDTTARVRIFTPTTEVPFAGHPNVGTAFVLAQQSTLFGRPIGNLLRFEEGAGVVEAHAVRDGAVVSGAAIMAPQPLVVGAELPVGLVAACASLNASDVVVTPHPPQVMSVGLPFAIARLASRTALAQARPSLQHFAEAARAHRHEITDFFLFLYVPLDATDSSLAARMFAPLGDVPEDPATGSAAAALAAYLVAQSPAIDADVELVLHQGEEMGRPSRIDLRVQKRAGAVKTVLVGGSCVAVMHGVFSI